MSADREEELGLTAAEETFVRRVSEAYAPPPQTASRRVAFRAALDARLARESRRNRLRLAFAAAAAAAAAVVVLRVLPERPGGETASRPAVAESAVRPVVAESAVRGEGMAVRPAPVRALAAPQEQAILALAIGPEPASEEALPADYEAIAGVFLGS